MKATGLLFITIGAMMMLYGFFMPIDVETSGLISRVSNLGLMHQSQLLVTGGGFVFLAGCVFSAANQLSTGIFHSAQSASEETEPEEALIGRDDMQAIGFGVIVILVLAAIVVLSQFYA